MILLCFNTTLATAAYILCYKRNQTPILLYVHSVSQKYLHTSLSYRLEWYSVQASRKGGRRACGWTVARLK